MRGGLHLCTTRSGEVIQDSRFCRVIGTRVREQPAHFDAAKYTVALLLDGGANAQEEIGRKSLRLHTIQIANSLSFARIHGQECRSNQRIRRNGASGSTTP